MGNRVNGRGSNALPAREQGAAFIAALLSPVMGSEAPAMTDADLAKRFQEAKEAVIKADDNRRLARATCQVEYATGRAVGGMSLREADDAAARAADAFIRCPLPAAPRTTQTAWISWKARELRDLAHHVDRETADQWRKIIAAERVKAAAIPPLNRSQAARLPRGQ